MNNLFALPLQRPRFVQNFKRGFCAQARHALRQAELVLNGFLHGTKLKLYPASAHARDRRLGGQAKRSWAVKSRECCEPSDACLLRGGAPANKHRTDPIRELLS